MNTEITNNLNNEREIRTIIDLYANYADTKQTDKQVALFADDYKIEIYYDSTSDTPIQTIIGKENLKQLFIDSLSPFPKTMHFNGQSLIDINSDTEAEGIVYCRAYHYSKIDDTEKLMIAPIRYEDIYKKIDNKWYFLNRKLKVQWIENR
ncbi:MAG: nuclear transport factor 2 family protein [Sphingobacteriales bacterium]|jgi:hypothetical protein|nr:MAG: nuclear transport factor 2 family protein [Sphingobacteriales bacterium]